MLKVKLVGLSLLAAVLLPLNAVAGDIRDLQPAQCKFSFLLKQEICDFAPYAAESSEAAPVNPAVIPEFRTILLSSPQDVAALMQEMDLTEEQIADLNEEMSVGDLPLRLLFFRAVNRDGDPRGFRLVKLDRAEYDVLTEYNGLLAPIDGPELTSVIKTFKLFLERKRKFSLKHIDALITYFAAVPQDPRAEAISGGELVLTPAACEDFFLNQDLIFEHCLLAVEVDDNEWEPTAYVTARLRHRGRALEAIAEELNLSEEQVAELQESVAHNRITRAVFFTETDEDPSAEGLNFRIFKLNRTQWDALASHEYSTVTADRRFVTFKLAVEPAQWGHILKREPFLLKTTRLQGTIRD